MTDASATREAVDPAHAKPRIDDGLGVRAHPARARRVVQRLRERAEVRAEVVVRPRVVAREDLAVQKRRERLLREDASSKPEAAEERCLVLAVGIGEVARVDRGQHARIGRSQEHGSGAARPEEDDGERQPVLRRLLEPLLLEEHGREEELEVRCGEVRPRADEGDGLAEVRRERAPAAKRPAGEVAQRVRRGERLDALRPDEQAVREVVDQVRADAGKLANDVDPGILERVARADARRAGAGAACRSHRRRGRPRVGARLLLELVSVERGRRRRRRGRPRSGSASTSAPVTTVRFGRLRAGPR